VYKSIKITDEDYKILEKITNKEERTFTQILSRAIKNYAISKKLLTNKKSLL
jgi:predicted CopG family antitoxin